eukprot:g2953.t1 g2953   contig12:1138053-1138661(-)
MNGRTVANRSLRKNGSTNSDAQSVETSTRGSTRYARRKRSGTKRKQSSSMPMVLGIFMIVSGLFFVGVASTLKKFPSSDGPSLRTKSNAVSENRQATVAQPDKNRERVSSILRINDGQPLSEEQEQQIINDAQDILDKFPISVGEDTNGQNPEWETILHPGTEALKHLHGESYTPTGKERSASDIAGILSGKKVKGGIAKEG